jgi:hypothetical protein
VIFRERIAIHTWRVILPIAIFFFWAGALPAQQPKAPPANATPPSETLKVIVLEGQDKVNNIRVPIAVDLVVEVRDQDDRPLEGALVNFQLPLMGPSGSFEGGVRNKEAITNVQGQGSASYTPNMEQGRLTIQVKATLAGQTGMTSIMQRNSTENEPGQKTGSWIGRHKKLVILVAAGVVGGVLAGVLTRGGSKSSSSSGTSATTLTITPGVPTVGGP